MDAASADREKWNEKEREEEDDDHVLHGCMHCRRLWMEHETRALDLVNGLVWDHDWDTITGLTRVYE